MNHLLDMMVFAKVVDSRNFSEAARSLGTTASAVSRSVQRLEKMMGGRLLNRTTRAMTITDFGQEVYSQCARMADTVRHVQSLAGKHATAPRGLLKVTAPVAYGRMALVPLIPRFLEQWPDLSIQLDLTDRLVDIVGEGVDVAVRISSGLPPRVAARPIGTVSHILVATPKYVETFGLPSEPGELRPHACVFFGDAKRAGEVRLVRGRDEFMLRLAPRLTVNDGTAALGALERNDCCIGLVPDFAVADALRWGRLHQVLPDWALEDAYGNLTVNIIYAPTRHLPIAVRTFIEHVVAAGQEAEAEVPYTRTAKAARLDEPFLLAN